MSIANPYTPGAGFMPAYLAGRDDAIQEAEQCMLSLVERYPQQSIIYYGLRGVGKTVLLNKIEELADDHAVIYDHIEVKEKGGFIAQLVNTSVKFLRQISTLEKTKEIAERIKLAIQALSFTYNPQEGTFGAELGDLSGLVETEDMLADKLTDVFVALGNAAVRSDDTICLFIDEIQYLKRTEMEALVNAIHRVNQKRLPIMIFGAGLPKIFKELGEAKTYSERLFHFVEIDALSPEESILAITEPAKRLKRSYERGAVDKIIEITGGYPYFIQEFCKIIWSQTEGKERIMQTDIQQAETEFYAILDQGFFRMRYDRCTRLEKEFMFAMIACEKLPCTISNVAQIMGRQVSSISPTRAKLISKGMIYATGFAEIDFTVPQFDNFLRRVRGE